MIIVQNLTKEYRHVKVLDDITIRFQEGVIYGLVGVNGCGKTTLMRCICGFTQPNHGCVIVNGSLIGRRTRAANAPYDKVVDFAPSTGVIIEEPGFLQHESGIKNLLLLANMSGKADKDRAREAMELLGLNPDEKKPVGKYSLGQKQRLGFAQALMENPDVFILDEPFNAMDKNAMAEVHALLQKFKAEGKIIILASHSTADIEKACDVIYEMKNGTLNAIKGLVSQEKQEDCL